MPLWCDYNGTSLGCEFKPSLSHLKLDQIFRILFKVLQNNGYVMIWVLEQTEEVTRQRMKERRYDYRALIIWEKVTKNDKQVNGNGWVTRHSIETLLIFRKGNVRKMAKYQVCRELIRANVRKSSLKPDEVMDEVLKLVPCQDYVEVYARKENLTPNVVSVVNQVNGTKSLNLK